MDIHKLREAEIDYEQGVERFANKAELYERFLLKFLEDKNYSQMILEIEKGDFEEAFKGAHALKGIAGNLSLNGLYNTLSKLVEALRSNQTEEVKVQKAVVQKSYEITLEAIKICVQ